MEVTETLSFLIIFQKDPIVYQNLASLSALCFSPQIDLT